MNIKLLPSMALVQVALPDGVYIVKDGAAYSAVDPKRHMHWASVDEKGEIDFAASLGREFIHGHINDSLNRGNMDAAKLVVRAVVVLDKP